MYSNIVIIMYPVACDQLNEYAYRAGWEGGGVDAQKQQGYLTAKHCCHIAIYSCIYSRERMK